MSVTRDWVPPTICLSRMAVNDLKQGGLIMSVLSTEKALKGEKSDRVRNTLGENR